MLRTAQAFGLYGVLSMRYYCTSREIHASDTHHLDCLLSSISDYFNNPLAMLCTAQYLLLFNRLEEAPSWRITLVKWRKLSWFWLWHHIRKSCPSQCDTSFIYRAKWQDLFPSLPSSMESAVVLPAVDISAVVMIMLWSRAVRTACHVRLSLFLLPWLVLLLILFCRYAIWCGIWNGLAFDGKCFIICSSINCNGVCNTPSARNNCSHIIVIHPGEVLDAFTMGLTTCSTMDFLLPLALSSFRNFLLKQYTTRILLKAMTTLEEHPQMQSILNVMVQNVSE